MVVVKLPRGLESVLGKFLFNSPKEPGARKPCQYCGCPLWDHVLECAREGTLIRCDNCRSETLATGRMVTVRRTCIFFPNGWVQSR